MRAEIRDYEDEWWYPGATKQVDPPKLKPKKLRKKKGPENRLKKDSGKSK